MKRVLVVEDNKDNLMLITMVLEHAGYQVMAAGTGEEGIRTALHERPFFIIMDINLPGIDGAEATRRIRSSDIGNTIPIIAITSYAMLGDREKMLSVGCNGYFEKPIDPLTIIDKIHAVVGVKP